ncbi:anti-sigma factor antagonist [Hylemonella gracilis]|jgi:anti-anti-sigma factor|uniref:Anti-sigma factor antagonist n=2 Tax=Hylemonella gracilis TaxID=80880 RepID=A0A4V1A2F4_9BURK|nr:anti-sigma factor antagonist [Hylemonella gracilis]
MAMLHIAGELTIYRAAELKELLLQALGQSSGDLEIDLSGVTEMDVAGLQVLMMAKQAAQALQRNLHLMNHSPSVVEVFEILNVTAFFGDPLVISESPA